ncbi:tetratricopeptide repeat protein [Nonomuraea sp. NN258]|uniref:tetratricopeptide repeat protein n=1 Tax=Nonomuraea antri TaxID=2730852 RepID=UPI001568D2E5|nr:tetratricopeptide repeat protein [Nonomuraea antri]NRQ39348.1 tetratricopeptide repeat protein [Nonomuraea antri]
MSLFEWADGLYQETVPLIGAGRYEEAIEPCRRAVDAHRLLDAENPGEYLLDLAIVLNNLSLVLIKTGRPGEAIELLREELAVRRRLGASQDDEVARVLSVLGPMLATGGDLEEGVRAVEEAVAVRRRLLRDDPAAAGGLAASLTDLARVLALRGLQEEAHASVAEGLHLLRTSTSADYRDERLATALLLSGTLLARLDRLTEALPQLYEASELFGGMVETAPQEAAMCFHNFALAAIRLNRPELAPPALIGALLVYGNYGPADEAQSCADDLKQLYLMVPRAVTDAWKEATGERKVPAWVSGGRFRWRRG